MNDNVKSNFMEPWVNRDLQDRINCIHEAGHIVIAHTVGLPIAWVSIDPDFLRSDPLAIENECASGDPVSMVRSSHLLQPILARGRPVTQSERGIVRAYCANVLAGPIAEIRAFPDHYVPETAARDNGQVRAVLQRTQPDRLKARKMLRNLLVNTDTLVEMQWPMIEAFAEKLRVEKTIMGDEIARFLSGLGQSQDMRAAA